MKKIILVLILASLLPLSGCITRMEKRKKMIGWEYVRIERQVPSKDCVYKIQDSCGGRGANCYDSFKRSAKLYGANVVVITEDTRSQTSSGSTAIYNGAGGGSFKSVETMTALADYYDCPNYKYGEQK